MCLGDNIRVDIWYSFQNFKKFRGVVRGWMVGPFISRGKNINLKSTKIWSIISLSEYISWTTQALCRQTIFYMMVAFVSYHLGSSCGKLQYMLRSDTHAIRQYLNTRQFTTILKSVRCIMQLHFSSVWNLRIGDLKTYIYTTMLVANRRHFKKFDNIEVSKP